MENIMVFLQLIVVAYAMSAGFGMIIAQSRGVQWVNRQWRRVITWVIRTPVRILGQLLLATARGIR